MKTLLVLFIAILAQTLGDVWLTKGMKAVGEVDTLVPGELLAVGWQGSGCFSFSSCFT
jgi:hypothetical protein